MAGARGHPGPTDPAKDAFTKLANLGGLSEGALLESSLPDMLDFPDDWSTDERISELLALIPQLVRKVVGEYGSLNYRIALQAALRIQTGDNVVEAYERTIASWAPRNTLTKRLADIRRCWIAEQGSTGSTSAEGLDASDKQLSDATRRWWYQGRNRLLRELRREFADRRRSQTWRQPTTPPTTARPTHASPVGRAIESRPGRIDREEASYFLDKHGCIIRSEHQLTVVPLQEGWDKVGPLVRLWRGLPEKLMTEEEALKEAVHPKVLSTDSDITLGGTSMSIPTGSAGDISIGLVAHDKAALTIGLPQIAPYTPHVLSWTMRYPCRGEETTGRIERAELFYVSPVAECIVRAWPDAAGSAHILVRRYDRLVPARDDIRADFGLDIGLGEESHYLELGSDGSYSAEFRDMQPLRYYGLEWWWGSDPHGLKWDRSI